MATTNFYSNVYISDLDGTNAVYMDIEPIFSPFIPPPEGRQITNVCLPGLSGGILTAGTAIHWDAGAHITETVVSWTCSRCTETTYQSLLTKYKTIEDVIFSFNNGVNAYQAVWVRPGGLFVSKDPPGRSTYNLEIKLKIVAKIA